MSENSKHIHDDCHCHDESCCHSDECDCCGTIIQDDPDACKQRPGAPAFARQDPDKGVSLGPDVEQEVAKVMAKRYERFLSPGETFQITTEICHQFGLVSARLTNDEHTTHVCIEVSVECEPNKIENPMDAYHEALDVMDLVWLDYFDSDRISHYLPIWQCYEIDEKQVNVRLEHNNPALDDAASEFLKQHGFTDGGLSPEDEEE